MRAFPFPEATPEKVVRADAEDAARAEAAAVVVAKAAVVVVKAEGAVAKAEVAAVEKEAAREGPEPPRVVRFLEVAEVAREDHLENSQKVVRAKTLEAAVVDSEALAEVEAAVASEKAATSLQMLKVELKSDIAMMEKEAEADTEVDSVVVKEAGSVAVREAASVAVKEAASVAVKEETSVEVKEDLETSILATIPTEEQAVTDQEVLPVVPPENLTEAHPSEKAV